MNEKGSRQSRLIGYDNNLTINIGKNKSHTPRQRAESFKKRNNSQKSTKLGHYIEGKPQYGKGDYETPIAQGRFDPMTFSELERTTAHQQPDVEYLQSTISPIKTLKQDDLDIEGMLKDVEEIERKIRKTIN